MADLVERQEVKDIFTELYGISAIGSVFDKYEWKDICETTANELPSTEPYTIHSDGRLWVTVDDIDKVNAVVVDESKSKFCKQFYMDAQPEQKTGHWILDRSGAYCCSKCMEPCASYAMMKPRDKFCKMCGSRNEVME